MKVECLFENFATELESVIPREGVESLERELLHYRGRRDPVIPREGVES